MTLPAGFAALLNEETRRNLKCYCALLRCYRRLWGIVLPGSTGIVLMKLPMPLLTGVIIDKVIARGNRTDLNLICACLVGLTLLYSILNYAVDYVAFRIDKAVTIRYKMRLLAHIQNLPTPYLAQRETGYLLGRIVQDPGYINGLAVQALSIANSVLTFCVGVTTILVINSRLAALSLLLLPFFAAPYLLFQKRIRGVDNQLKEQIAVTTNGLKESLSAVAVTKLFLLQARELHGFLRNLRLELDLSTRSFNYDYAVAAASGFFAALGPLVVVWYGGHEVIRGNLTVGQLVAFSALLGFLYGPTKTFVSSNVGLIRAVVSLNRVHDILEAPPELTRAPALVASLGTRDFDIEFRRVEFNYPHGSPVLKGIDLAVPDKAALAIIGTTGAGKSTVLSLLTRGYDPTSGEVLIGGRNISTLPLRQLRRYVSVVPQQPFLFSTTVFENIRFGKLHASRREVLDAAQRANATAFIESLPKGFETPVGEEGQFLSGGQRQLICLARVILRNSPILLLDEPTSSIDSVTEELMRDSLSSFIRQRTTIVVSHRLSTILDVDRIAVLQDGVIADIGSHLELVSRDAFYCEMTSLQSGRKADKSVPE